MSIFAKILGSGGVEKVTASIGSVVDKLNTTDDEKMKAKNELVNVVLNSLVSIIEAQKEVIVKEMGGNFLQRTWRPLIMLTFGVILVCKWFGWTNADIPNELELELMSIVKLGLGGYVIGRSAEKIASEAVKNVDLPFIKKKDRKQDL